jgi:hypothetical protein
MGFVPPAYNAGQQQAALRQSTQSTAQTPGSGGPDIGGAQPLSLKQLKIALQAAVARVKELEAEIAAQSKGGATGDSGDGTLPSEGTLPSDRPDTVG